MKRSHRMPFGAEIREDGSVRFRLWAPKAKRVEVCLENGRQDCIPLTKLEHGWFEVITREAGAGSQYRFQIDGEVKVSDPASRFQPQDVYGASQVIDPQAFDWNDDEWLGRRWAEAVIYELHLGTFTPEGTFLAAEQKLDYLRDLGVTAVELMPVADFSGNRNWGYDGVLPYAPDSSYGRPEDLKRFVQAAHAHGLMVFLDVVYNHFGPDGNYLRVYSPQFFTDRQGTPWGDAINFDGPDSRVVRDFFIHNALYWLEEYHLDGLRLDAVHAIVDDSTPDILQELAQTVRERFEGKRLVHLVLENVENESHYLQCGGPNQTNCYSAQWNDDIHHALQVLITGECDGYYADYTQQPLRSLARCLTEGFAYQGEYSAYHQAPRGEPTRELPLSAFVSFLQNHDQVGNRAFGERISQLAAPQALKAAIEILLIAPSPPLLFMGEEFGAASPFLFFCDFTGDLARAVTEGRRNEFARFAKFSSSETRSQIPDPNALSTFRDSKLDWSSLERDSHAHWLTLYRELLAVRQQIIFPLLGHRCKAHVDDCDDTKRSLAVSWHFANGTMLKLHANFGHDWLRLTLHQEGLFYCSSPEAAEAAKKNRLAPWAVIWSVENGHLTQKHQHQRTSADEGFLKPR